jgi:fructuronate reductase
MDGSQKLPQRLLGAIQDRLARNLPIATHALAVAGWMRYVTGRDEKDRTIDVRDPLAAEFAGLAREAGPVAERLAPALLGVGKVFGPLGAEPRLREAVTVALGRLYKDGARRAVETLVSA